jgi:hypothetical protein
MIEGERREKVKGHYRVITRDEKGRIVSARKWTNKKADLPHDAEYWSLNCTGDSTNCVGCPHWRGKGACLFDECEEVEEE